MFIEKSKKVRYINNINTANRVSIAKQLVNKNSKFMFILPLIFFAFPIIFSFSKNMNEEPIHILQLLSVFIIVAFLLWLILGYALKNRIKSSLIVSFWAALFFSYGHARLSLDGFFNISSTGFLFITFTTYIILFIVSSIFIIKTKRTLNNAVKIIMISSIIVIIFPIIDIGQSRIYNNDNDYDYAIETHQTNMNVSSIPYDGPDVYYILPDAYAGSKSTEAYWNFDNGDFKNFLSEIGFYVAQDSYSNYDYTGKSVPSIMNMKYVYDNGDLYDENIKNTENWLVFDNFRSKGYTTYFIESGIYLGFPTNNIDHKLCSPSDLFDSFFMRNIFQHSMILAPGTEFILREDLQNKVICSFDELDKMSKNDKTPKFVLTHIMSPHSPFVFNSTGGNPDSLLSNIDDISGHRDSLYIDQIQFVNYKLKDIIRGLVDTDDPPIIIIQSDHGKRDVHAIDDPTDRNIIKLNNFRAYYLPNGDRNLELENNSPVNTFRVLFNTYFDDNYDILENKFYVLNDAETDYVDVTNSLINSSN